jgi:DNA gyrase/topoisomerase IV subunit B
MFDSLQPSKLHNKSIIIVKREGNTFKQDYIRGIAQHELYISNPEGSWGTEIILKPDTSIFGSAEFSLDTLNDWVKKKSKGIDHLKIEVRSANAC